MSQNTETGAVTVEDLMDLWGGDPSYRVVPCFLSTAGERPEGEAWLRSMLDDSVEFTVDERDAGAERLRRMARRDPRCSDFAAAADLLEQNPADWLLLLGWSVQ